MVILYNSTVNILHIGLLGSARRDKQPLTLKFTPMNDAESKDQEKKLTQPEGEHANST